MKFKLFSSLALFLLLTETFAQSGGHSADIDSTSKDGSAIAQAEQSSESEYNTNYEEEDEEEPDC